MRGPATSRRFGFEARARTRARDRVRATSMRSRPAEIAGSITRAPPSRRSACTPRAACRRSRASRPTPTRGARATVSATAGRQTATRGASRRRGAAGRARVRPRRRTKTTRATARRFAPARCPRAAVARALRSARRRAGGAPRRNGRPRRAHRCVTSAGATGRRASGAPSPRATGSRTRDWHRGRESAPCARPARCGRVFGEMQRGEPRLRERPPVDVWQAALDDGEFEARRIVHGTPPGWWPHDSGHGSSGHVPNYCRPE